MQIQPHDGCLPCLSMTCTSRAHTTYVPLRQSICSHSGSDSNPGHGVDEAGVRGASAANLVHWHARAVFLG